MNFLPGIFLYIHTPIYYFYLFIDISKRFLGLIIMIRHGSCISCVRSNSMSLLFPSWTLIDTERVVGTPKTCQVWILVLASPPRHIPEMIFFSYSFSTLLNVMWQSKWEGNLKKNRKQKNEKWILKHWTVCFKTVPGFLKSQPLTITFHIYWISAIHIRHY